MMHPAVRNTDFTVGDVWPRRAPAEVSLPRGQRLIRAFPRFSDDPRTAPPAVPDRVQIEVGGAVDRPATIELGALQGLPRLERTADFHCVTTWSVTGLRWSGWSFHEIWDQLVVPSTGPAPDAQWLVAIGLDGYRSRLHLDDALAPEVLIVDRLEARPLDGTHGAPLRLVSPGQYGYKSVKHLCGIEVHRSEPSSDLGPKEHPRARVEREERHARLPAGLVRWPYRILVPPTAIVARRAARRGSGSAVSRSA